MPNDPPVDDDDSDDDSDDPEATDLSDPANLVDDSHPDVPQPATPV